jgi:ABC-type transporter Mla subunit MlaD
VNNERRKQIGDLINRLDEIADEIDTLSGEEEDALNNLPESFQDGEKGEKMQTAVNELCNAHDYIADVKSFLETAQE